MRRLPRQLGASATTRQSRHTPQGWIFSAPTLSGLGPRPHFLVDEAQRAKLDLYFGISFIAVCMLLMLPIAWIAAHPLMSLRTRSDWNNHLAIFFALILGLVLAARCIQYLALRAILKNLPRTTARITLLELLESLAMIAGLLFLIAMLLACAYDALIPHMKIFVYLNIAMLGAMVVLHGAMRWTRHRLAGRG